MITWPSVITPLLRLTSWLCITPIFFFSFFSSSYLRGCIWLVLKVLNPVSSWWLFVKFVDCYLLKRYWFLLRFKSVISVCGWVDSYYLFLVRRGSLCSVQTGFPRLTLIVHGEGSVSYSFTHIQKVRCTVEVGRKRTLLLDLDTQWFTWRP